MGNPDNSTRCSVRRATPRAIHSRIVIAWLCVVTAVPLTAIADSGQDPVSIELVDAESMFVHGPMNGVRPFRIGLQVQITNQSDVQLDIRRTQFRVQYGDDYPAISTIRAPDALQDITLASGQSTTGWIWFTSDTFPDAPSPMQLIWRSNASEIQISVDDFVARESAYTTQRLGPLKSLLVIRTSRRLDALSFWHFVNVLARNEHSAERLVIAIDKHARKPDVSEEIFRWLFQALSATQPEDVAALPFPTCPTRFLSIHLAGFNNPTSRSFSRTSRGVQIAKSEHDAVAETLTDTFRHVDMDALLIAFESDHPGVRRAVVEAAIQRLTLPQIEALLQTESPKRSDVSQMIASRLDQVADPAVLPLLQGLAADSRSAVSRAAVRALTLHPSPQAVTAILEIWEQRPDLHEWVIQGAIESRNDRWGRLISDYAVILLRNSGSLPTAPIDTAPLPPAEIVDPNKATGPAAAAASAQAVHAESRRTRDLIRQVLDRVPPSHVETVLEAACDSLDGIESPMVQDAVAMFIVEHNQGSYSHVIRQFIAQRLQTGSLTDPMGNLIYLYPDSRWTATLLKLATDSQLSSTERQQTMQRAIRCATRPQLDWFVDAFAECSPPSQHVILQHLAEAEHPAWRRLADEALTQRSPLANKALDVLHTDGTEQSMQLLCRHLQHQLDLSTAEQDDTNQIQLANRLLTKISLFSHPEARRVLNRATRSPVDSIRHQAIASQRASRRRSLGNTLLSEANELNRKQDHDAAMQRLNACIDIDPLFAEAWLYRAALLLRTGHLDSALSDLRTADALSPEDTDIQSTIAITYVRMGNSQEGLQLAEDTLALAPEEPSNLYNTACVYARAAETPDLPDDQRAQHVNRAFRLLFDSTTPEFADPVHVQQDHDLFGLHDEELWPGYLELVQTAADAAAQPR